MSSRCIGLDFSTLDQLHPSAGQYRYAMALVEGLARLDLPVRFSLIGTQPEAPSKAAHLFSRSGWHYRRIPSAEGRMGRWLDPWRFHTAARDLDLLHVLHTRAPWLERCPVVVTKYDLMEELFPEYEPWRRSRMYRLHKLFVKRRAARVICISQTTADDLQNRWEVQSDRIDVVFLGTDLELDERTPRDPSPALREAVGDGLVISSPFNLEPRKNLSGLLEACAGIRSMLGNARLVLFGRAASNPEREALFVRRMEQLGLKDVVRCVGIISDADLRWLYGRSDLFVFPSLYEGFGLPVLEAMWAGTCVVAREGTAQAEILGQAGVLTETKDPGRLGRVIEGMLRDPEERRKRGEAARGRAAEFTSEKMASRTWDVYDRVMNRRPG